MGLGQRSRMNKTVLDLRWLAWFGHQGLARACLVAMAVCVSRGWQSQVVANFRSFMFGSFFGFLI